MTDGLVETIRANGLDNAEAIRAAQKRTKPTLPLAIACALAEIESGGRNVFGNDVGGVFSTPGEDDIEVTAERYIELMIRVAAGEKINGVGPAQITWPPLHSRALKMGLKLWEPEDNLLMGYTILGENLVSRKNNIEEAGTLYNAGSLTNGVTDYGRKLATLAAKWNKLLWSTPATTTVVPAPVRQSAPVDPTAYTTHLGAHNGVAIKYHIFSGGLTKPSGVTVFLHGDNKPTSSSTPTGAHVKAMATASIAAGHPFVLAEAPAASWYLNYEATDQADAWRNQRTEGSQVTALRTFLPAVAAETGVAADGALDLIGHSGGGEAITLHLARDLGWTGTRKVRFGIVGAGTPNAVLPINADTRRASTAMLFAGSESGDGAGIVTANAGRYAGSWAAATRGQAKYSAAGHPARLWDTGAPSHLDYDFASIVTTLRKEAA